MATSLSMQYDYNMQIINPILIKNFTGGNLIFYRTLNDYKFWDKLNRFENNISTNLLNKLSKCELLNDRVNIKTQNAISKNKSKIKTKINNKLNIINNNNKQKENRKYQIKSLRMYKNIDNKRLNNTNKFNKNNKYKKIYR